MSEVGNGLRSASLSKRLQVEFAAEAFADFLAMNPTLVPMSSIGANAMEIALKHRTTFYDAAYVALAIEERVPVLAVDGPMSRTFSGMVEFQLLRSDDADVM